MKQITSFLLISTLILSSYFPVLAADIDSSNFKITGATINSGGQPTQSGTGDFKLLSTMGDFSADPRTSSTNYISSIGQVEIFTANVPKIACFETTTEGSSNCTTGPAYLNSNGMTRVCGPTGCYDRARFEIDVQGNPTDTLYAIQISTDNFVSDIQYIDGVTYKPIAFGSVTIDDYKTKTAWETNSTNILGLEADTQYYIRAIALHGDFSESKPGPIANTTTALPTSFFDIDIASTSGVAQETVSPYSLSFSDSDKLIQTGPAQTSDDLIWLDAQTNGQGGLALVLRGVNGGLDSAAAPYLIESATADLDGVTEGFGAQSYYSSQLYENGGGNGSLSSLLALSPYTSSGNNVGIIDTLFGKVYESSGPTYAGRSALLIKARASNSAPEATDYQETIYILMVPKY